MLDKKTSPNLDAAMNESSPDREYAIRRIINAYRSKVRRKLKVRKLKHLDVEGLLGCSVEEFAQRLEKRFSLDMHWGNYGTVWVVETGEAGSGDPADTNEFLTHFRCDNFRPVYRPAHDKLDIPPDSAIVVGVGRDGREVRIDA